MGLTHELALVPGYQDLYGTSSDAMEKIKKYPLQHVIAEISLILFSLRSPTGRSLNYNINSQWDIITYLSRTDPNRGVDLTLRWRNFTIRRSANNSFIFNRPGLLLASQYALKNLKMDDSNGESLPQDFWNTLIDFILTSNEIVVKYQKKSVPDLTQIEKVNAQIGLLNELQIISDPLLTTTRFVYFHKLFSEDKNYGTFFNEYLGSFGLTAKEYIHSLFNIWYNKYSQQGLRFVVSEREDDSTTKVLLKWLSQRKEMDEGHDMDIMSLAKWPLVDIGNGNYLILDLDLLLDKAYHQIFNDFYFDFLKEKKITYQTYRGFFGDIYEDFVLGQLSQAVHRKSGFERTVYLSSDDLKADGVELADFVLAHNKKVILGEIKSSNFTREQKFGGPLEFYKGDKVKFYHDYGIDQLVMNIERFAEHRELFRSVNQESKLTLYPVLVLNDKFFETPFMPQIMNMEFKRRIRSFPKIRVMDLTLMSASDIQRLSSDSLDWKRFWKLFHLKKNSHFTWRLNHLDIKHYDIKPLVEFMDLK